MALQKFLILPQLIYYGMRSPRDQRKAWDRFWSGIHRTGPSGEVLWDTDDRRETDEALARMRERMDFKLPIADLGCGNGRFTRLFAPHFPRVVAGDFSAHAVERAREESRQVPNASFRVLDVSEPGAGRALREEIGSDTNVFMRGVLHVLDPGRRAAAVANLGELLGQAGTLYLSETSIQGDPLDHLVMQGATATGMPEPLRRCIEAGIRPPSRFGDREIQAYFPATSWEVLTSGPATMYTVPLTQPEIEPIASYFAMVRRRRAG